MSLGFNNSQKCSYIESKLCTELDLGQKVSQLCIDLYYMTIHFFNTFNTLNSY